MEESVGKTLWNEVCVNLHLLRYALGSMDGEVGSSKSCKSHLTEEPEDVATRRPVDRQLGRSLRRDGEIPLSPELERLELYEDFVAMLLTGTKSKLAQGIRGHHARVTSRGLRVREA